MTWCVFAQVPVDPPACLAWTAGLELMACLESQVVMVCLVCLVARVRKVTQVKPVNQAGMVLMGYLVSVDAKDYLD